LKDRPFKVAPVLKLFFQQDGHASAFISTFVSGALKSTLLGCGDTWSPQTILYVSSVSNKQRFFGGGPFFCFECLSKKNATTGKKKKKKKKKCLAIPEYSAPTIDAFVEDEPEREGVCVNKGFPRVFLSGLPLARSRQVDPSSV